MRCYTRIARILTIIKYTLLVGLVLYILCISTNSIFILFNQEEILQNKLLLINTIDFKKFIYDTYTITFIITLFVVGYYSRKNKYSIVKILKIISMSLFLLPISALLNYNFTIIGSLMSSFYLVVVVAVILLSIEFCTKRINSLYDIAVGSTNESKKGKGDNKKCKKN